MNAIATLPENSNAPKSYVCGKCHGTGSYLHFGVCFDCNGKGRVEAPKHITVWFRDLARARLVSIFRATRDDLQSGENQYENAQHDTSGDALHTLSHAVFSLLFHGEVEMVRTAMAQPCWTSHTKWFVHHGARCINRFAYLPGAAQRYVLDAMGVSGPITLDKRGSAWNAEIPAVFND